jgi:hypothetical protein
LTTDRRLMAISFQGSYPSEFDYIIQSCRWSGKSFMLNEPCCLLSILRDSVYLFWFWFFFVPLLSRRYIHLNERMEKNHAVCDTLQISRSSQLRLSLDSEHTRTRRRCAFFCSFRKLLLLYLLGSALASLPLVMGESSSISSGSYIFLFIYSVLFARSVGRNFPSLNLCARVISLITCAHLGDVPTEP